MNIVTSYIKYIRYAYKHIPGASTVAMLKTVIENLPDSSSSRTKRLVNAFLICLIARYPPFLLRAESPSASACAIALFSCCEHVQRCIGLKRLRVIDCKGNKKKSYMLHLITFFFYFLPFSVEKHRKRHRGNRIWLPRYLLF